MASLEERVVARLREEKVKLWLAPYDDDGALTATANTYAAALDEADVAAVAATLRDLRRRAVEKLAAKRRRTVRGAGAAGEPFEVALDGGTAGADARAVLAAAGGYDGRVRVIAGGRALVDGATLAAQGWPSDAERAGRPLRAILIAEPAAPAVDEPSEVDRLLDACDRLARDRAFDISDGRSGRRVRVPPAARPALVQAVALHARGKRCGDAAAAIDFFLAADEAFDRVRAAAPALVDEVDNFGFLQLDLCRAYALLGDGACLDDAERRLAAAERSLARRFDDRYEGRGVAAARAGRKIPAAFVPLARCKVLRALAAACRGADASALAADGACLLAALRHDAAALAPLEALGASRAAALAALRRAEGDAAKAAAAILDAADRRGAKRKEAPIVAGGGATSDGSFVDARALDRLGRECPGVAFEERLAALKRCDNNWSAAAADLRRAAAPVDAAKLAALLELGADRAVAEAALRACDGDVDHAAIRLASGWRPPPAATPAPAPAPVPAPPLPPPPPRVPRPPMDADLEAAHRLVEAELGGALEDEDADAIDGADLAYETALLESLRS